MGTLLPMPGFMDSFGGFNNRNKGSSSGGSGNNNSNSNNNKLTEPILPKRGKPKP